MQLIPLSDTAGAILALCIVLSMFALFLKETFPTEVVAIAGVALMLPSSVKLWLRVGLLGTASLQVCEPQASSSKQ